MNLTDSSVFVHRWRGQSDAYMVAWGTLCRSGGGVSASSVSMRLEEQCSPVACEEAPGVIEQPQVLMELVDMLQATGQERPALRTLQTLAQAFSGSADAFSAEVCAPRIPPTSAAK